MTRSGQPPCDRILWALASLNGKTEWSRLRRHTKLRAAELDAVLSKLVKDGRISIISKATWGPNRAIILLKRSE